MFQRSLLSCSCKLASTHYSAVHLKRGYAKVVGDRKRRPYNERIERPPRWKMQWAMVLKQKAQIEGPIAETPRAERTNWNYDTELNAFRQRMGIDVTDNLLRACFRAPAETSSTSVDYFSDYRGLAETGSKFTHEFVSHYLSTAFPLLPPDGSHAVLTWLLRVDNLAHLACNLGYGDLVCGVARPEPAVHADTFLASIGAVLMGEGGPVAAGKFVLDFVVPQLTGKDILHDIWKQRDPMSALVRELRARDLSAPEARLVRQTGVNTVTPTYFVALFADREFVAESAGESIVQAEADAATTALRRLYGVETTSRIAPMGHRVDNEFLSRLFKPLVKKRSLT